MTDVVAVLSIPIEGDPKKIEAALARVESQLQKAERTGRRTGVGIGQGFDQAAPAARRAEQGSLAFARALAQLQRESGDTAQAIRTLEGALSQQTQAGTAYINTQRQMIRYQRELATEQQVAARGGQGLAASLGSINTALSAVGIGFAVDQVVQFGIGAINSANQLEQTTAVMRQLAGSQQRYDQIVALATNNQRLFGGSLNDNLVPLNSLLQLANRTGAELNNLNQTTQLLLASAPNKSFGDASFGLSEFLSGTGAEAAISLADQFNLPKAALAELAQAGTTAEERLIGLNALLAEQGVTSETLAARLDTTAATYDRLGASLGNLQTQIGGLLAQGFAPVANELTVLADGGARMAQSLAAGVGPIDALNQAALNGAGSYEQYAARLEQALQGSVQFAQQSSILQSMLGANAPLFNAAAQGASNYFQNVFRLGEAEAEAAIAAQEQAAAVAESTSQYAAAYGASSDAAAGSAEAAASMDLAGAAADRVEVALRAATAAASEQENAGADLQAQAEAAAQALLDNGAAGEAAAAQLARSSALVDQLTAAHYRLLAAQQAVGAGRGGLAGLGGSLKGAGETTAGIRKLYEVFGTGPLAPRPTGGRAGGGRAGGAGGRSGTSEAEKAQKAAEREAQQEAAARERIADQFYDRRLDAEESFQERLTEIAEEFAERRAEADEAFGDAQVSSRSGFYQSLASVDASQRTAMIQEYEAAQQKAAEITATVGGTAGEEYLAKIAEVIRQRAQRQAQIAEALEDGNEAEAEFLRGVDQLARQDEQRQLDKITSGGNSLASQEAEARADAEAQRQEALTDAAATAGEALAELEREKTGLTEAQNAALQTQLQLYDQLAQRGGLPSAGGVGAAAAAPATPTPAAAAAPAASGLPGAGNGGPVTVTDPGLEATVRRAMADLERAIRALGDRPNYSPGV